MNFTQGLYGMLGGLMAATSVAAGSYALGDSADEAARSSQALIALESLSQTAGSVMGKRIIEGSGGTIQVQQMVEEGYLVAYPRNPTTEGPEGRPYVDRVRGDDGRLRDAVLMPLAPDSEAVCDEVSRLTSGKPAPVGEVYPETMQGCVRTQGGPIAFWRIG